MEFQLRRARRKVLNQTWGTARIRQSVWALAEEPKGHVPLLFEENVHGLCLEVDGEAAVFTVLAPPPTTASL